MTPKPVDIDDVVIWLLFGAESHMELSNQHAGRDRREMLREADEMKDIAARLKAGAEIVR